MFLFNGLESHPRSLVKAVSWRTVGSIDTFILGLLFTGGDARVAGSIAGTEVVTKIALFYFHERAWSLVHWGRRPAAPGPLAAGRTDDGIAPDA